MKTLIIARHGAYEGAPGYPLSSLGRQQIKMLGEKIKVEYVKDAKPRILTSTAGMAMESARILGDIFSKVQVNEHPVLYSDNSHQPDIDEALALIDMNKESDVVIIVTHFEFTQELHVAFGRKVLGLNTFPIHNLDRGHAWVIDCEKKTAAMVAP